MNKISKFLISIVGSELVGLLSTPFTIAAIPTWYATLNKPFFSPPNWIFGPVWTLLYFLMGYSFYLIWSQGWADKNVRLAAYYFFAQAGLNFAWSGLFFGLRSPLLGFIDIILLMIAIILTIKIFYPISRWAAYLLIPYLLWVSFATILNFSIIVLN